MSGKMRWLPAALFLCYAVSLSALAMNSYSSLAFSGTEGSYGVLLVLALFAAFFWGLAIYVSIRQRLTIPWVSTLVFAGIAGIAAVATRPFQSADPFYYMTSATMAARYGLNPYFVNISQAFALHPDNSVLRFLSSGMGTSTFPYGYVFYGYLQTIWHLALGNQTVMLYLHKAIMLATAIGCGFVASKVDAELADRGGRSPLKTGWWILIVGLNPLVLLEGVAEGHNDLMIAFLILTMFLLLLKRLPGWAVFVFLVALQLKFSVIFLVPFLLVWCFREGVRPSWKIAIYGFGALLSFIPYWLFLGMRAIPPGMLSFASISAHQGSLLEQLMFVISSSVNRNTPYGFAQIPGFFWYPVLLIITVLYAWKWKSGTEHLMLWCGVTYLLYLGIFTTYLQQWYILWLLPFVPLLSLDKQKRWLPVLVAVYMLLLVLAFRFGY
jgi:hypothetical protein